MVADSPETHRPGFRISAEKFFAPARTPADGLLTAVTEKEPAARLVAARLAATQSVFDKLAGLRPAVAVLNSLVGPALPGTSALDLLLSLPPASKPGAESAAAISIFDSNHRPAGVRSCWRRGPITETGSRPRKRSGKENCRDARLRSFLSLLRFAVCPSRRSIPASRCRPEHFSSGNNP